MKVYNQNHLQYLTNTRAMKTTFLKLNFPSNKKSLLFGHCLNKFKCRKRKKFRNKNKRRRKSVLVNAKIQIVLDYIVHASKNSATAGLPVNAITASIQRNSRKPESSSYKKQRQFIRRPSKTNSWSLKTRKSILKAVIVVKVVKTTTAGVKKWVGSVLLFVGVLTARMKKSSSRRKKSRVSTNLAAEKKINWSLVMESRIWLLIIVKKLFINNTRKVYPLD